MDSEVLTALTAVLAFITELIAVFGIISKRGNSNEGISLSFLNGIHIKVYKFLAFSSAWALIVAVWALAVDFFGAAVMDSEIMEFLALLLSAPALLLFAYSIKWLLRTDAS